MASDQRQDSHRSNPPEHTPEEEMAFNERIRALADYHELADESIDPRVHQRLGEVAEHGSLEERQQANYLWHHRWYLIAMLVVIAILIAVAVFYFGSGDDLTAPLEEAPAVPAAGATAEDPGVRDGNAGVAADAPGGDASAVETWVAENLEAASAPSTADTAQNSSQNDSSATDAGTTQAPEGTSSQQGVTPEVNGDSPSHFVGEIATDNGWFRMTVNTDGSVSGTLNVAMEVPGGRVEQTGSYVGTINSENLITCTGSYQGVSIDEKGAKYPHEGTVILSAYPTKDGTAIWQVDADGDPGDPVSLPARSQ